MPLTRYDQHPNAITDYPCDWQLPSGVTISSVASTVAPAGPTVAGSAPTTVRSQTRVTSPAADVLYQVEETVTFSNGEKRVQEFEVMGKNA